MQSSVGSTQESRGGGSIVGLVGQPIVQEDNSVPSSRDFNDQVPEDCTQELHATAGAEGLIRSIPGEKARYQRGVNKSLDLRFEKYKKKRL